MKLARTKPQMTAEHWADRINSSLKEGVVSAVEAWRNTGLHLIDAKEELDHGEWEKMFAGHPQAVKHPIQCSIDTAQRLMKIAIHPVLSKTAHGRFLPPSWRTLYELTKVPEPILMKAIGDGRICAAMERKDVRALRNNSKPKSKPTIRPIGPSVRESEEKIRRVVLAEKKRLPLDQWDQITYGLEVVLTELQEEMKTHA